MNKQKWLEKEYPEFLKIREKRNDIMNKEIKYHNSNIASLLREEDDLREKLSKSTTKERIEFEQKIDEIRDTINNDKEYQNLCKEYDNIDKEYRNYIRNNLVYKEKLKLGLFPSDGWYDLFSDEEVKKYEKEERFFENIITSGFCILFLFILVFFSIIAFKFG